MRPAASSPRRDRPRLGVLAAAVMMVALVASPSGAAATPQPSVTGADLLADPAALETFVDELMAERVGQDTPGAAVAIVHGEEIVHAAGYGDADVATGDPVSASETTFMVGSVGKLVTWTAVMQGVEQGTLDLDAPVDTYLEDSTVEVGDDRYEPITLRHLGTHTAGFAAVANPGMVTHPEWLRPLEQTTAEDRPERVRPPGERIAYSNYGATLAGHIVAQTQGLDFDEYVRERIFAPLGMTHATFTQPVPEEHPGQLAGPHTGGGGSFERADPVYIGWGPAGSMSASATDMAAFMSAHLGEGTLGETQVLEADTHAQMLQVHHERHPAVANMRYGFWEHGGPDTGLIAHTGGTMHATSVLLLAPEQEVGIFVAYNVANDMALPDEVAEELAKALELLPEADSPPAADDAAAAPDAEALAGEYRPTMAEGPGLMRTFGLLSSLTLAPDADGGIRTSTLAAREQWVPGGPDVFVRSDGGDVLATEVEDGEVAAVYLSSQPMTAYEPVPGPERASFVLALFGGALLAFLISLIGWAGVGIWRRLRSSSDKPRHRLREPGWLLRTFGVGLCLAAWAMLALIGIGAVLVGIEPALVLQPWPVELALAMPYLILVLAVATSISAVLAWRHRYGSVWTRMHHSVLAVLGLAFLWPLNVLGLL